MRILVTRCAFETVEVVSGSRGGTRQQSLLVAIAARNGDMRTRQLIARCAVPCERERGGMESLYGVAIFAAIAIRRPLELPHVDVFVAVRACRKLDFIDSIFAGWCMALGTLDGDVLSLQWILRFGMAGEIKKRRLKSRDRVTGNALPLISPLRELPVVRVAMTIGTPLESDGLLEIPVLMAL